jgi:hypothetical protein
MVFLRLLEDLGDISSVFCNTQDFRYVRGIKQKFSKIHVTCTKIDFN